MARLEARLHSSAHSYYYYCSDAFSQRPGLLPSHAAHATPLPSLSAPAQRVLQNAFHAFPQPSCLLLHVLLPAPSRWEPGRKTSPVTKRASARALCTCHTPAATGSLHIGPPLARAAADASAPSPGIIKIPPSRRPAAIRHGGAARRGRCTAWKTSQQQHGRYVMWCVWVLGSQRLGIEGAQQADGLGGGGSNDWVGKVAPGGAEAVRHVVKALVEAPGWRGGQGVGSRAHAARVCGHCTSTAAGRHIGDAWQFAVGTQQRCQGAREL